MKHTDPTTLPVTDAPVLSPAAELLLRAADAIETLGHAKCALRNRSGGMCVLGAMKHVAFGDADGVLPKFDAHPNATAFYRAYGVIGRRLGDIPAYNNASERTPAEVIRALRDAAYGADR
jgi:hypothetical protein